MIGVLLLQLGTPAEPTAAALRPWLAEFLSDPRVIEVPRWLWWPILHGVILPFRPARSAAKYARIWSPEHGSPLRHFTERQRALLGERLGPGFAVEIGMRYGQPATAEAIDRLAAAGAERLLAFALYPQYSAPTAASSLDALFEALLARRRIPALRVVPPFPTDEGYLAALEARLRERLAALDSPPDHIVCSFHGLPVRMIERGDPYRAQCEATFAALRARFALGPERWTLTYQSRFGRDRWLEPATEPTLVQLARRGARRVLVVMPGFPADCLETLDEIGHEAAQAFGKAGGELLALVPCLNDHPKWIDAMEAIVRRETLGWIPPAGSAGA